MIAMYIVYTSNSRLNIYVGVLISRHLEDQTVNYQTASYQDYGLNVNVDKRMVLPHVYKASIFTFGST